MLSEYESHLADGSIATLVLILVVMEYALGVNGGDTIENPVLTES